MVEDTFGSLEPAEEYECPDCGYVSKNPGNCPNCQVPLKKLGVEDDEGFGDTFGNLEEDSGIEEKDSDLE